MAQAQLLLKANVINLSKYNEELGKISLTAPLAGERDKHWRFETPSRAYYIDIYVYRNPY